MSVLAYLLSLLEISWFRVILFLVIAPVIVTLLFFWSVIVVQYVRLQKWRRKTEVKPLKSKPKLEASMSIEHPVPIEALAVAPPPSAWDPEYLLEHDPRYVEEHELESDVQSSSETLHQDEYEAEGDDQEQALERDVFETDWDTEEDTFYQSDEYTDRGDREDDTEIFTETEDDDLQSSFTDSEILEASKNWPTSPSSAAAPVSGKLNNQTEANNQSLTPRSVTPHYQTPAGVPRPVSR